MQDIIYNYYHEAARRKDHPCNLPLHMALNKIRFSGLIAAGYGVEDSCFPKLLTRLSLPITRNLLETDGLLASKTEETKEEFLHFARNGQVKECYILLVVARKKLLDSVAAVGELVGYLTQRNELGDEGKRLMIDLIYLFHKAGDEIEAYVKKDKLEGNLQVIPDVICLLQQAGFHAASEKSIFLPRFAGMGLYTQKVADIGMPHYSRSGSRWDLSKNPEPEPNPGCYKFKVPADKKLRNSRMPFWFTFSNHSKVSANAYHSGLESGSDAKLKKFGFNSSNILSSKPWSLLAGVIKRIAGR